MTDNDIIKALECCVKDDEGKKGFCNENCPLFGGGYICAEFLRSKTLDLLNRKDAEIEKLNVELVGMRGACESYRIHYDVAQAEIERLKKERRLNLLTQLPIARKIKTEAIKEFAERLKEKYKVHFNDSYRLIYDTIDNLVKEMTEQSVNYGSSKLEER